MLRVIFDTNIFDALADDSKTLSELITAVSDRKIQVLITHIQRDELERIPKEGKRLRLLSLLGAIGSQQVLTEGAIYDVSNYDEAKYGADEINNDLDTFIGRSKKKRSDALIAITGDRIADWLVTRNMRDFKALERIDPKTRLMDYEEFKSALAAL